VERLAGPQNWKLVLQAEGCERLRINFAHFGGEEEVERTAMYFLLPQYSSEGKYRRTWTWRLIRLLKTYDNTFADISAFDFRKDSAGTALRQLLALDEAGRFDEPMGLDRLPPGRKTYKLSDKLLWGSDVPLMLDSYDYRTLFRHFEDTMKVRGCLAGIRKGPRGIKIKQNVIPGKDAFIAKLTSANPYRFLFGAAA
jgi:hypothetical protein